MASTSCCCPPPKSRASLSAGRIHLGVTGSDLIRDKLADWDRQVAELAPLGFGHADLIIAVPAVWIDVDTLDDLDAAAAAFRATHGHRLRIATKYHRLVRDFLTAQGIADYQLVDSQGATEGTVKNLTAEAIADITSTRRDAPREPPQGALGWSGAPVPGHALRRPHCGLAGGRRPDAGAPRRAPGPSPAVRFPFGRTTPRGMMGARKSS